MTAVPETSRHIGWAETITVYLRPRVLIVMFLGLSSGLPLALSGSTLLVWMREVGVDLGTIGLFALVGTPYTIKFLWAPLVDALGVPVLSALLGRRRGWLVFSQLLLMAATAFLAFTDPAKAPWLVAFGALMVATASATQDIVIDAYRRELLTAHRRHQVLAQRHALAVIHVPVRLDPHERDDHRGEHGQQRRVRGDAAHAAIGGCVQMRVADLQEL